MHTYKLIFIAATIKPIKLKARKVIKGTRDNLRFMNGAEIVAEFNTYNLVGWVRVD